MEVEAGNADIERDNGGKTAFPQKTSEQIVSEAYEGRSEKIRVHSRRQFLDLEELRFYQQNKRSEFEKHLNKNRLNLREWLRYARWEEEENHDIVRARSIYERALEVNIEYIPFWTHYVQLELVHKNINHARNLLDRGVTTLPFVEKLWFLYVQTEEVLRNYSVVRDVFERWLLWNPNPSAWVAYINFEKRYDEFDNARKLYSRYVIAHPNGRTWLEWIDFEMGEAPVGPSQLSTIRYVFESAVDNLLAAQKHGREDDSLVPIVDRWANWEVSVQEYERARMIYHLLLDTDNTKIHIKSPSLKEGLRNASAEFEKRFGNTDTIESSIIERRRLKYEQDLAKDPTNSDLWWLYLNILHDKRDNDALSKAYEDAISNVSSDDYKSINWKRHIYIWIRYALWLEFDFVDVALARDVWNRCIKIIPHKKFTFGKVWINYAKFEIRNDTENGVNNARKILGRAIGSSSSSGPKGNIFNYYIRIETTLGEWDRIRKLYEKWMELSLACGDVSKFVNVCEGYANFERKMGEIERSASILIIAFSLIVERGASLDVLETIMDNVSAIYFAEYLFDGARDAYRKFSEIFPDPKVWISRALFELKVPTKKQFAEFESSDKDEIEFTIVEEQVQNARALFSEASTHYKENGSDKDRATLLQAWEQFERVHGTEDSIAEINKKLPQIIQKRRIENGIEEEYSDYVFPDDGSSKPPVQINKFLENAKKWALQNS